MARIRVRARAVDMLGRQQIAGIPTAIHELFKNAHDAYAHLVRVDYIHSLNLLLLRDDGLGMTRSDLENKWLTLGTESKVDQNDPSLKVWTGPESLSRRATLGEKGIGRLAIAAIGPQVLVISRAVREDGLRPTSVALVNWSIFEQPGIDLDRIDVPVIELSHDPIPSRSQIDALVQACRENVLDFADEIRPEARSRILRELDLFGFEPSEIYVGLGSTALDIRPYGTHFIIKPTNPELSLDLNQGRVAGTSSTETTPLERYLLGFGNTMRGGKSSPPITAEFWEHRQDGSSDELIGPLSFFTPEEFTSSDHHVDGTFDAFGTFRGTVRIYDTVEHQYTLAPPPEFRGLTECGPFSLTFAYIQGQAKDTRMPLDEWKRLTDKCDRIGGLYIYRDGIRILPYGNSDYDWLNIERRRTLAAKDWFFSYRRLFGAVEITHAENTALVEKAGREGFRQNKAYRQFAGLLEELFQRLAVDFFRENSKFADDWMQIRAAKQREYVLLQKRAKQVAGLKREFNAALEAFFENARSGSIRARCAEIERSFSQQLDAVSYNSDPVAAGEHLLFIEADLRRTVKTLEASVTISRPRSFGLNKRQRQDWDAYTNERRRMLESDVAPVIAAIEEKIRYLLSSGRTSVDPRRRLDEPVKSEGEAALLAVGEVRHRTTVALAGFEKEIRTTLNRSWAELRTRVENVKSDLARTEVAKLSPDEIERRRDRLVEQIRETSEQTLRQMQSLTEQLSNMAAGVGDDVSGLEITAALESQNEELRNQVDQYADLAQIGMALGLVQHEFTGQVRNINRCLNALRPWADRNRGLLDLYNSLRISFEHLESYLQLFIPLNRRLQRRRVAILGSEIEDFLKTVFEPRLERHRVELLVSSEFRRFSVVTFPSTLFPVFVNIVDNGIYWVSSSRDEQRAITLDIGHSGYRISNNGPGIDERDRERIFEFGETTKPGGRGMGLYLAREALRREGMDIHVEHLGHDAHPTFVIEVPRKTEIDEAGGDD